MLCPNCQTTNPPHAKFCLECGLHLVLCPQCGAPTQPQAKFCIECGTPLPAASNTLPSLSSISPLLPSTPAQDTFSTNHADRKHLPETDVLISPEERRVVTIMFADITGSTPLADRLDPEDMRAILAGYFNLMAEQIRRHGGTVEKYIGDAIMAVFGLPSAHEDDPDRAIRAAVDMQKALERFNNQRLSYDATAVRLQMRIGINTGEVAAPTNASPQGQDFLVTGDAVNIAARLQQVATPDTILVGERTCHSARGDYEFQQLDPFILKGKAEPVAAYTVCCSDGLNNPVVAPLSRGIAGHTTPLIGRMLELTLLHTSYARVQAERRPHLITILGTPGVGKTRLVREFLFREQERVQTAPLMHTRIAPLILRGRCLPYGEGITYWPMIEILRTLLQAQDGETGSQLRERFVEFVKQTLTQARRPEPVEDIARPLLRNIGHCLSGQIEPIETDNHIHQLLSERQITTRTVSLKEQSAQNTLLRAWRILIEALANHQPLIIVIDDIQWADEALLNLLEYLADRLTTAGVLFLCPARPDFFEHRPNWGGGHRNFTTIELEALSWDESSELVNSLLNTDDLPDALRNTILTRAEGNPFFVEEIIQMLMDRGALIEAQDTNQNKICWRIGHHTNMLFDQINTPGEPPEDTLLEEHYLLSLPYVPDTIQGVLAARVDLLLSAEKLLLQYGAIIGRTFWLSSLHELAKDLEHKTISAAITSLLQRDFIVEREDGVSKIAEDDRVFHFKHVLIRDVVYNHIPRQRRAREHARLAYWLESQQDGASSISIELLAYHYQQALTAWSIGSALETIEVNNAQTNAILYLTRSELRERAIHFLELAGNQAMQSYYTLRAIRAYIDAFDLLQENQASVLVRSKMLKKLGDAFAQRTNLDEAWRHYQLALMLVTENEPDNTTTPLTTPADPRYLLILYEHLALLATRWLGQFDEPPDMQEAYRYIEAGLQMTEQQSGSRERIVFLAYQALWFLCRSATGLIEQKKQVLEQALQSSQEALQQSETLGDPSTHSLILDAISFVYESYHLYNKAVELQMRRLSLEPRLTEREERYDLYLSLGGVTKQVSDYSSALMWQGRAWSIAQTMESPAMLRIAMVKRMKIWQSWGRWDEAEAAAHETLRLIEKYQIDERRQFWPLETLAWIACHRGNQEASERYIKRCKRLLDIPTIATSDNLYMALRMGALYYANQELDQALEAYRELLLASEPWPEPEVLATLAHLLLQTDQEEATLTHICERAISVSKQAGARKSLAVALCARGSLSTQQQKWTQAIADLRQSIQLCRELDLPWEQGHTLVALGNLYQQQALAGTKNKPDHGNLGRAHYYFEQALGFYESLRAAPRIQQVQRKLENLAGIASDLLRQPI